MVLSPEFTEWMAGIFTLLAKEKGLALTKAVQILSINFLREDPTPGTVSTCMYYTGLDPYTLKPVYVAKTAEEKAMQRALLQYYEPRNAPKVRRALELAHREDLIGTLCPGRPPQKEAARQSGKQTV